MAPRLILLMISWVNHSASKTRTQNRPAVAELAFHCKLIFLSEGMPIIQISRKLLVLFSTERETYGRSFYRTNLYRRYFSN